MTYNFKGREINAFSLELSTKEVDEIGDFFSDLVEDEDKNFLSEIEKIEPIYTGDSKTNIKTKALESEDYFVSIFTYTGYSNDRFFDKMVYIFEPTEEVLNLITTYLTKFSDDSMKRFKDKMNN